jgi:hypothetical protein
VVHRSWRSHVIFDYFRIAVTACGFLDCPGIIGCRSDFRLGGTIHILLWITAFVNDRSKLLDDAMHCRQGDAGSKALCGWGDGLA